MQLNPEQESVVTYTGDKYLSVEAGPGAGKTRVIIERVKYLLNEVGIDPSSLLIITFSRKAADELQDRLADDNISSTDIKKMQISTIHSFCSKILEKSGAVGFDVIDDDLGEKINMFIGKHADELGFVGECYLPKREVGDVIRKYNEYCTFKVDTPKLVEYIENTHPVCDEYVHFVNEYMAENDGAFPRDEVRENEEFKKAWYNAKYLQIAKSYEIYKELLNKYNVTDFNHMQVKALEILRKNPETRFKNILIDEFQDTDPVQMEIFEILMENTDSFTVVGDINQSIYGFRGSSENYFDYLADLHGDDVEPKSLPTNYRSTYEIIDISQDYIRHQQSENTALKKAKCGRDVNNEVYYLINPDNKSEALNIFNIIKYLYDNGKINSYDEIGILTRSVKGASSCIDPLIELLAENDIPYQIKGRNDLFDKNEIKSILTLLHHLIEDEDPDKIILTRWEKEWLNLKAYTGANFEQKLFDLSDDTKAILNDLQDDYENQVIAAEKVAYEKFTGKKSRLRSFAGVFNRDEEILEEIFKTVEKPVLTDENLVKYGVTDSNDLEFFRKLNALKSDIFNEDLKYSERPTILDIYLTLLTEITDCLSVDVINDDIELINNLSVITNTFDSYEDMMYDRDIRGAYWFIYRNIESYASYVEDSRGVQIMTVHKSKGLEFPVVILASLNENRYPLKYRNPNPESGYMMGRPVYYTPCDCLEYKNFEDEEEELKMHNWEEERVIYVAMTRAEDTLILSSIVNGCEAEVETAYNRLDDTDYLKSINKGPDSVQNAIDENLDYCRLINPHDIDINVIDKPPKDADAELITLSFSALEDYLECPFKYRMAYEVDFRTSNPNKLDDGIFIHKALEVINKKIKAENNTYIGNDRVKKIVSRLFHTSNIALELEDEERYKRKLETITRDVIHYYEHEGSQLEIIESEYPFFIKTDSYSMAGIIDLIFKDKDGHIGILDYKNTAIESKFIDKYSKQLHLYRAALKEKNQKFSDVEIEKLYVYAIKSKKMISIDISDEKEKEVLNELNATADNIISKNFPSKEGKHCEYCQYKKICNR